MKADEMTSDKWADDMTLNTEVSLPYKRRELVISLKALSSHEYQYAIWVRKEFPQENFYDDLENTLNIIYDDSDLDEDPYGYIGSILKNQEEAQAVEKVVSALNVIGRKYGQGLSNQEYIEKDEWRDVLAAAKDAHALLKE